ncbi:MAG: prepilin-type N-terminal cleavage/methylation domain-containing protein [Lachnospiraceae bacterium]|nr:prepilin-type N-terminal cleavage/methylation domain-containing protein [Lachnospiraceae bacterium]
MKERKMNNKGFSLVELIIVIAIMAILIVVLAPQYLRYVERSRNSTDQNNAAAMESAFLVWGTETDTSLGTLYQVDGTGSTATVTDTGTTLVGTNAAALEDALENAGLDTSVTCISQTAWTQYVITVTVDGEGNVSTNVVYN